MDRRTRGIAVYARQFRVQEDQVVGLMTERFGSRLTEEALHAGAGAWTEDQLSLRDRSLIVLAALAVQGGVEGRMRPHVRWALEHGASPEEIEATVALTAVYAGFPRASTAMEVVREELARARGTPRDTGEENVRARREPASSGLTAFIRRAAGSIGRARARRLHSPM